MESVSGLAGHCDRVVSGFKRSTVVDGDENIVGHVELDIPEVTHILAIDVLFWYIELIVACLTVDKELVLQLNLYVVSCDRVHGDFTR